MKAALLEAAIAQQRSPQVADADQRRPPGPVHAQQMANGPDQLFRHVTDAGTAKAAETGQILAHLGVSDAERLAELAARHLADLVAQQCFEMTQIQAEA